MSFAFGRLFEVFVAAGCSFGMDQDFVVVVDEYLLEVIFVEIAEAVVVAYLFDVGAGIEEEVVVVEDSKSIAEGTLHIVDMVAGVDIRVSVDNILVVAEEDVMQKEEAEAGVAAAAVAVVGTA